MLTAHLTMEISNRFIMSSWLLFVNLWFRSYFRLSPLSFYITSNYLSEHSNKLYLQPSTTFPKQSFSRYLKSSNIIHMIWASHVMRREKDITKVIMLNKIQEIKIKRDRPNTSWVDCIRGDLKRLGVVNWKRMVLEMNELKFLKQVKCHGGL